MGRLALVTGGTRGIGASIAVALKNAGHNILVNYANNERAARELFVTADNAGFIIGSTLSINGGQHMY
ncbi:MAG: hypothetical protein CL573_09100 [Alphaproteobacteria bacterium]|nr:hypothetical protein [Alphaproteobacteria bacterium]